MNRMTAFLALVLFAAIFLLSYLPTLLESKYGNAMNIGGQAGMGLALILFFILPGKRQPPPPGRETDH